LNVTKNNRQYKLIEFPKDHTDSTTGHAYVLLLLKIELLILYGKTVAYNPKEDNLHPP
jgi:hypothetical protein